MPIGVGLRGRSRFFHNWGPASNSSIVVRYEVQKSGSKEVVSPQCLPTQNFCRPNFAGQIFLFSERCAIIRFSIEVRQH